MTDHLLIFWIQLLVLLSAAHALGALARRFGQPPVVGALAAGLLLSPSVLGAISPDAYHWLFPDDPRQQGLLQGVAWIGVALLVLITGFETDLALVRRLGRAAASVAVFAQVIPFATGFGVGMALPEELLGGQATRVLFALFMATALSISALPVIARMLVELDLMRRNFGQITLAAATADDVVGWVLLGAIAGAARSGSFGRCHRRRSLRGRGALPGLRVRRGTAARRRGDARRDAARRRRLRRGRDQPADRAAGRRCTQALGLEAIFGTFVAGVLLGRSRYQTVDTFPRLETLTSSFFAPLFFASAGVRADLSSLADPAVLGWGLAVFAAACAAKFSGAFIGSRIAGLHPLEGLALGAALNARGAVGLVVATVGLGAGVLNRASYTIVVLIAMATSMMAPPALRILRAALAGRRGGAGAARARAPPRPEPARAAGPRAVADPRRSELGARCAHPRPRLARGYAGHGVLGGTGRPRRRSAARALDDREEAGRARALAPGGSARRRPRTGGIRLRRDRRGREQRAHRRAAWCRPSSTA